MQFKNLIVSLAIALSLIACTSEKESRALQTIALIDDVRGGVLRWENHASGMVHLISHGDYGLDAIVVTQCRPNLPPINLIDNEGDGYIDQIEIIDRWGRANIEQVRPTVVRAADRSRAGEYRNWQNDYENAMYWAIHKAEFDAAPVPENARVELGVC